MRHHDDVPVQVKAGGDEGRFSALVSVFDVIDRAGDRMMAGSFSATLRKWRESAKRIPIVWSHQTDSPDTVNGSADPNDVRETPRGLQVDGVLDIADSSIARRAFDLLKNGTISGWSFAYIPKRQKRRNGANEVYEVELLELGPTVSPVNAATATLGVKALDQADDRPDLEDMTTDELRRYSEALIEPIIRAKAVDRGPVELVTFDVA